ncbi:MAG: hypothetical protein R3E50_04035 [Halioglobus sp.]
MNTIRYRVNAQDVVVEINGAWKDFAVENDQPSLGASLVLGRPIWQFIAGMELRHLYELVVARVRQKGESVTLPFRCDAPDSRRYMEMSIRPLPDNGVEYETRLLRLEQRPVAGLLAAGNERSESLLAICSWCKRVQVTEGEWVEVEEAVSRLDLFQRDLLPPITHGICPDCRATLMQAAQANPG